MSTNHGGRGFSTMTVDDVKAIAAADQPTPSRDVAIEAFTQCIPHLGGLLASKRKAVLKMLRAWSNGRP